MNILQLFLLSIFSIMLLVFIHDDLIPYIQKKYHIWKSRLFLKRLAKKMKGTEFENRLLEVAECMKEISRETKLIDDNN